jgi:hypothetical protein
MPCVSNVGGAFVGFEWVEEGSDTSPDRLDGAFIGFSDKALELCAHHLDGVEVRAVGWQEQEPRTDVSDGLACFLALMAAQVVEDNDANQKTKRAP